MFSACSTLITVTIRTKLMPYNGISTGDFPQDLKLVIKKYMQGQQLEAANQELPDLLFSLATKIGEKSKSIVVEVEESSAA